MSMAGWLGLLFCQPGAAVNLRIRLRGCPKSCAWFVRRLRQAHAGGGLIPWDARQVRNLSRAATTNRPETPSPMTECGSPPSYVAPDPPLGSPVMVGPHGRLRAHELMFCTTPMRYGLSMTPVMRRSPPSAAMSRPWMGADPAAIGSGPHARRRQPGPDDAARGPGTSAVRCGSSLRPSPPPPHDDAGPRRGER